MALNTQQKQITIQDLAKDEAWVNKQKQHCRFCGKTEREQIKGCKEISCYRQFLKKKDGQ